MLPLSLAPEQPKESQNLLDGEASALPDGAGILYHDTLLGIL